MDSGWLTNQLLHRFMESFVHEDIHEFWVVSIRGAVIPAHGRVHDQLPIDHFPVVTNPTLFVRLHQFFRNKLLFYYESLLIPVRWTWVWGGYGQLFQVHTVNCNS